MNNILRWLATNLRIFLLAFILAMAVWVTAVTTSDPERTSAVPPPVTIEYIGQDPGMILSDSVPTTAEISLSAPESVWQQIESNPNSVRAIVDLTDLSFGEHDVEVVIQIDASPVRIVSVKPASIHLSLEPLATINLDISLSISGEPAIGYQSGEAILIPDEVVISGPESIVSKVKFVRASIDLTNANETLESNLPLAAFDDSGTLLTGLTLSPATVKISLPVTQLGGYRDLAVKVVTVGRAASGYRIASVAAFPPIVTVYSADAALIESLPGYVETTPLDLSGGSENIETRLSLILPSDVTLVGEQTVLVQVGITAIESSLTLAYRPVDIIGLESGLTAVISPITVDVILSGPIPALDSLNFSDVSVSVDATGRGPGTYQLTPLVTIAVEGVTVQSVLPSTVQVTISGNSTPFPR